LKGEIQTLNRASYPPKKVFLSPNSGAKQGIEIKYRPPHTIVSTHKKGTPGTNPGVQKQGSQTPHFPGVDNINGLKKRRAKKIVQHQKKERKKNNSRVWGELPDPNMKPKGNVVDFKTGGGTEQTDQKRKKGKGKKNINKRLRYGDIKNKSGKGTKKPGFSTHTIQTKSPKGGEREELSRNQPLAWGGPPRKRTGGLNRIGGKKKKCAKGQPARQLTFVGGGGEAEKLRNFLLEAIRECKKKEWGERKKDGWVTKFEGGEKGKTLHFKKGGSALNRSTQKSKEEGLALGCEKVNKEKTGKLQKKRQQPCKEKKTKSWKASWLKKKESRPPTKTSDGKKRPKEDQFSLPKVKQGKKPIRGGVQQGKFKNWLLKEKNNKRKTQNFLKPTATSQPTCGETNQKPNNLMEG